MQIAFSDKPVQYYNLDMIISVRYLPVVNMRDYLGATRPHKLSSVDTLNFNTVLLV